MSSHGRVADFRQHPAICDLPSDLQTVFERARQSLGVLENVEADCAYHLALLARATAHRRIGTKTAAEACAEALGRAPQTLRPFAILAAKWDPGDLRDLLALRDCYGKRLSVSHLQLLGRLSRSARQVWLQRTLAGGLSVRELRNEIRKASE